MEIGYERFTNVSDYVYEIHYICCKTAHMVKITIILPIYNVETYICRCMESIGAQDYTHLECIVVDDCSTDQSMDIVRDFTKGYHGPVDFRTVTHPHNMGIAVARNSGTAAATGDYVMYVDSDDALAEGAVSLLAAETERHPGIDIVQGVADCTDPVGSSAIAQLHSLHHLRHMDYCDIPYEMGRLFAGFLFPGSPWNKLVRLDLLRDNGITFHPQLRVNEDWLWVYCLCRVVRTFAIVHEVTYHYTSDAAGSLTHTLKMKRSAECWKTIFKEVFSMGVPRPYGRAAAYRCLDLYMQQRGVEGAGYDEIAMDMSRWMWRCGVRLPALLLASARRAPVAIMRKVCNAAMWRVARRHFPRPWW